METESVDSGWRSSVATWAPVVLVAVLSQTGLGMETPWTGSDLLRAATGLACALPLAWRQTRPVSVAAVLSLVVAVQPNLPGASLHFGSFVAVVLATYAVARHTATVGSAVAGGALLIVGVAIATFPLGTASPVELVFPLFYLSVAWLAGRAVRLHEERGERLRTLASSLERERDQEAQLAVATERVRIARELHDIVAHTVGIIVVQAEAAEERLQADPEASRRALHTIQDSGRQGMQDLRRLLGVLRDDGGDSEGGTTHPQPSLEQLDALVQDFREAGMDVDLRVAGELTDLPSGVQLSVFRLVQEALSNALRHSHAGRADVRLARDADGVTVEVSDGGPPRDVVAIGGHGMVGMRERVAIFGGEFRAGPDAAGGYRVSATIPLDRVARADRTARADRVARTAHVARVER